jgi:Fe-S-cluster containining protein
VPVSAIEAIDLDRQLDELAPGRANRFRSRLDQAARRLLAQGPPPTTLPELSDWYARLQMPCPLLEDDRCSIYTGRPLACREHLVTSAPELCRTPADGIERLTPPVSMLHAVATASARLMRRPVESIPLVLARPFAQLHARSFTQTCRAADLAGELARAIDSSASSVAA